MEEKRTYRRPHSIFWPLFLIVAGVFLFLNTLNLVTWGGWELVWRLWPLLFVVGGLDGLYRRDGFVGPLVAIGFGTVILMANLGYLTTGAWTLLLRLWPVLLIALGLDFVIGRHSLVSALIGIAAGLVLIGGIAWFAMTASGPRSDLHTEPVRQALNGAATAAVSINAVAGDLSLVSGAEPVNLLEGQVQLAGNTRSRSSYTVSGSRITYKLDLENTLYTAPFGPGPDENRWTLKLNAGVPLDLDTNVVFGQQTVDLTGTHVQNLKANTVFGRTELALPVESAGFTDASVVFGQLVLRVPRSARLVIEASTAFTGTDLPPGFTRQGSRIYSPGASQTAAPNVRVNVPFGSLRVEYQ